MTDRAIRTFFWAAAILAGLLGTALLVWRAGV
jgi:hypothetical protein